MALTLNGDGTIVGLAAGGLSDLSVATADIADAAITAAKMSGAQSGDAPAYAARAWVNFNGTSTVAIRASGNVSSITDNGTGDYTVNFTTAMADANISVAGSAKETDSGTTDTLFKIVEVASNPSASSVRVMTGGASSAWDSTVVMVSVFR